MTELTEKYAIYKDGAVKGFDILVFVGLMLNAIDGYDSTANILYIFAAIAWRMSCLARYKYFPIG